VLRILVFFNHDPGLYGILPSQPTQVVTGGYKRFLEIAKRIGKYGVELDVVESFPTFLKSDRDLHYKYHEFTTPALKVDNARFTDPWLVAWKMARVGKKLAKKKHFDLILSPSESLDMCLAAFLVSRETKIPWGAVIHHLNSEKPRFDANSVSSSAKKLTASCYAMLHSIFDKRPTYFLYNNASIVSVSQSTEKVLHNHGVKSAVFICGNGLNLSEISAIHSGSSLYDGIFVGRFVKGKGLFEALKIFEKICNERPGSKFALVGGGDQTILGPLREEIAKKKLERNIEILGYVDEKTKIELIKSSKIFIYPSHIEGWGIVVGEALACGLPVICYDLPPFKEVFNCEAVRICKEWHVDQMVAETMRLLKDEEARKRLAFIGRNFVKRYDWDEVAKKEAQIYRLISISEK
jgi:glycosyltransferase involved in cell wall biosynthesis